MFCEFCAYLQELYGGSHYFQDTPYGKILYVVSGPDKFKINLSDKVRFGKFSLYHRNSARLLSGGYCYHVQAQCRDLSYALYMAYAHHFHKVNKIFWHPEDYHRFMQDWRKYCEQVLPKDTGMGRELSGYEEEGEQEDSPLAEQV